MRADRGINDYRLGLYDVTVEIVKLEANREIAWKVEGQLNLGHVYGYTLRPIDGGTSLPRTTTGHPSTKAGRTQPSSL